MLELNIGFQFKYTLDCKQLPRTFLFRGLVNPFTLKSRASHLLKFLGILQNCATLKTINDHLCYWKVTLR